MDVVPNEHSCTDTFTFLQELKQANITDKFITSFDVVSLFTHIPLKEMVDLAVNKILTEKTYLKMYKKELEEFYFFATSKTNFLFNGRVYDQIDGIAMGSPLSPIFANLFMRHHEKDWLDGCVGEGLSFYQRHVDDILVAFQNEINVVSCYLNERHPNIKFTKDENLKHGELSFLDVLIKNNGELITSIYHKDSYTGLLTNFRSFVPRVYKCMLVNSLTDRTFKINNA